MQHTEIIKAIEEIAPLAAAAGWDVSGQQVAAHRQDVAKLAVCLDPTPASVRTALEKGAQFVLSHHPLLLKAVLPHRLDDYHEVLRLLFQADVPLYAA
ncbi:MAG: Nif3-like dinuclear metal center hexameric protein, partial [Desulfovibrio desulfuricans]|nr:Nif3-like dinuclear metal center hexameric protein [Desulfovibrio desulfuricans]